MSSQHNGLSSNELLISSSLRKQNRASVLLAADHVMPQPPVSHRSTLNIAALLCTSAEFSQGAGPPSGGNPSDLGSSLWRIKCRMTGSFPPWTLTLKGDERSSRPHFSSSNWAAIIREGFSYPFTPAVSLLHLSSIPLSLILGEVDERVWCFKSFSPHVHHASAPLFL